MVNVNNSIKELIKFGKSDKIQKLVDDLQERFPVNSIIYIKYSNEYKFYKVIGEVYVEHISNTSNPDIIRIPLLEFNHLGELKDKVFNQNIADIYGIYRDIHESSYEEMFGHCLNELKNNIKSAQFHIKNFTARLAVYQKDLRILKKNIKEQNNDEVVTKRI